MDHACVDGAAADYSKNGRLDVIDEAQDDLLKMVKRIGRLGSGQKWNDLMVNVSDAAFEFGSEIDKIRNSLL